jgi:hypothetical protein
VCVPHDLLDRLENLHSGNRLSDVLSPTLSGGLTATPPRISRPSKARRASHQHSDRTDPSNGSDGSDEDSVYGASVAFDHPPVRSPPEKPDDAGQVPGYQTPEEERVTLRWLLYALMTRGGGVVRSQYSADNAPQGNDDSLAEGVETKETVGVWWAKWGLCGAAVASRECHHQDVWRDSVQRIVVFLLYLSSSRLGPSRLGCLVTFPSLFPSSPNPYRNILPGLHLNNLEPSACVPPKDTACLP